jgi:hypothetical protein
MPPRPHRLRPTIRIIRFAFRSTTTWCTTISSAGTHRWRSVRLRHRAERPSAWSIHIPPRPSRSPLPLLATGGHTSIKRSSLYFAAPFEPVHAFRSRSAAGRSSSLPRVGAAMAVPCTRRPSALETGSQPRAPDIALSAGRTGPSPGRAFVPHARAGSPAIDDAPAIRCTMATRAASVCGIRRSDARENTREQNCHEKSPHVASMVGHPAADQQKRWGSEHGSAISRRAPV